MAYIFRRISILRQVLLSCFVTLTIIFSTYLAYFYLDAWHASESRILIFNTEEATLSEVLPALPMRLVIPAIEVDAHIQHVGLSTTTPGEMGVPTNLIDVAWYKHGPVPGALGNAVIDGHLNWKGVPRAVFYRLDELNIGDLVEVTDENGEAIVFRVVKVRTYDYTADPREVFVGDLSVARLNLITCGGEFLTNEQVYSKRTVVFTERVDAMSEVAL